MTTPTPAENEAADGMESDIHWPLSYHLQAQLQPSLGPYWSYRLYRGPEDATGSKKKVQVLYSKDRARSETLAQRFLNEPVVGFDMEWSIFPSKNDRLQEKIGLIQVASEDTIALFHIGLHPGKTTDEIIAPSLRKLIESPTVAKTGVGILSADFARLRRYFGLQPQGAFELSHLHRLVKFAFVPDLLTTKMVKLAHQVEEHLGLPLSKGAVRTSNWSRPLSQAQIDYAASDAYAGFMLFHCMDAKRLALKTHDGHVPPLPIFADRYPSKSEPGKDYAPITTLMLHPAKEGGSIISAKDFFSSKKESETDVNDDGGLDTTRTAGTAKGKKKATKAESKSAKDPLSDVAQILFDQLSNRRKALAKQQGVPAYVIASNAVLHGLAQRSPQNEEELLEVKGIGKVSLAKYGAEWLEVVAEHMAVRGVDKIESSVASQHEQPSMSPQTSRQRQRTDTDESPGSSPAFGSPVQRTPVLHTGLSFNLADTKLEPDSVPNTGPPSPSTYRANAPPQRGYIETLDLTAVAAPNDTEATPANGGSRWSLDSSNTSEDSLVFTTPPSRSPPSLKRKRSEHVRDTVAPTQLPAQPVPLSLQSKIFRNKLVAFSRLVTRELGARPSDAAPIVSDSTLDQIVAVPPQTAEELDGVVGIEEFARACKDAQMDLLRNIIKWAPTRP